MENQDDKIIRILYINWKGSLNWRTIIPETIDFKSTEWHPEKQWILHALDLDKQEYRDFAMKDIKEWKVGEIDEV